MKRDRTLPAPGNTSISGAAQTRSFVLQFRDSFLKHWQVERGYTLAVGEAMPAEHYDFRPNPDQRAFGEQLIHLAWANTLYFSAFGLTPPPTQPTTSDRETVLKYVATCFDYVFETLKKLTENDLLRNDLGAPQVKPHRGIDVCLRAYTHTAHHRGQVIVYLRMKGITPPSWASEPTA